MFAFASVLGVVIGSVGVSIGISYLAIRALLALMSGRADGLTGVDGGLQQGT